MEKGGRGAVLESSIRRRLRRHFRELGFSRPNRGSISPLTDEKQALRALHARRRVEHLRQESRFIRENYPILKAHFAEGDDLRPDAIDPRLKPVEAGTESSDLFRLACLTWGVPVSAGYGRRMRFLVSDNSNGKLMGIIGLADPVFNLRTRDQAVGWNAGDRKRRLVDVMNAYVLGALPPYNMLLGGKVISCLVRTREVRNRFAGKYRNTVGLISGKRKSASLVLVTTSSSLGKSAVYDRLKLGGMLYFESVGFTSGWGHFHVPDRLFQDMRKYLRIRHHPYANGHAFGEGSNWRLRTSRATLQMMNMDSGLMNHGVEREVFLCRLASNAYQVLNGEVSRPEYRDLLSVREVGRMAIDRWVIRRSRTRREYMAWTLGGLKSLLDPRGNGLASLAHLPVRRVAGESATELDQFSARLKDRSFPNGPTLRPRPTNAGPVLNPPGGRGGSPKGASPLALPRKQSN